MRTLTLLFLVVACAVALACRSDRGPATSTVSPAPIEAPLQSAPPQLAIDDDVASIYDLAIELRDHDGRAIDLDVHRGHPVVIAMFYASCPAACPRLIAEVFAIVDDVPADRRHRLRVLLVSFDQRDTPARLRQLAAERQIPLDSWTLATATPGAALELAAVLGIKYRALDSGEYYHSSIITVLDDDGRPRARVEGFGTPRDAVVAAIR
jgi:protein SCO1/2